MPRTLSRMQHGRLAVIGLVLLTCTTEPTMPRAGTAYLAVRPVFAGGASLAAVPLTVDAARLRVTRAPADTLVDTLVPFPVDADSIPLQVRVTLNPGADTLTLALELDAGAQAVFTGTASVLPVTGQVTSADLPVRYVGPGRNVGSVVLAPRDTIVTSGDSVRFRVLASDSGGAPVGAFYVTWSSSDSAIPVGSAGEVRTSATARQRVFVRARTPTGIGDSTSLTAFPVGTQLVKLAGDSQTDTVGRTLPQQLTVAVHTSRGLGVSGIPVSFQGTAGGGRVVDTLVVSDAAGRAASRVVLDTLVGLGVERFTATAPGLSPVTFAETAIPGPAVSLLLFPDSVLAVPGQAIRFQAVSLDAYGNFNFILSPPTTWASSDPAVATVDPNGLVQTIAAGSTVISATNSGRRAAGTLTVCDSRVRINVNDFDLTLEDGVLPAAGPTFGLGFYKGTEVIYGGGVLYGTSGQDLILGFDASGLLASDLFSGPVCVAQTGPLHHTIATLFSVNGPPGLVVTQESFAFSSPGDNGYVLLRYGFTNVGTTSLAGLDIGFLTDWDMQFDNTALDDALQFDSPLQAGEATESDTVTYPQVFATVPIGQAGPYAFQGYVGGGDPTDHAGFFALLSGGITPIALGPADIRDLVGNGPLSLPPGQTVRVYFALVGGDDRAAFGQNLAAARAKAASLGF